MPARCILTLILICLFLNMPAVAADQDVFTVGSIKAGPGESVAGFLDIEPLHDGGARIPVSVIRGRNPGPVLALLAGVHGYEYPGITALQRLRKSVRTADLSGTLILVHIANPPSFYGRTVYTSPADGKNLNRVFPGKKDGSLSERIADSITRHVIEQADFLVDLHAGDGNEVLRPYVYMPVTGQPALDAASRGMALAFGLDHIIIDEGRLLPRDASLYTDQTALTRTARRTTWRRRPVRLSDVVRAEWIKFRSVRSTRLTLLGAGVATVGLGMIFAATASALSSTADTPSTAFSFPFIVASGMT